jgi:hypothetical protein
MFYGAWHWCRKSLPATRKTGLTVLKRIISFTWLFFDAWTSGYCDVTGHVHVYIWTK